MLPIINNIITMLLVPIFMSPVLAFVHVAKLFNLPEYLSIVGITMCAAPVAANTAVTAEVYDNDSALAAKLVGITTLFCLITMPLMLYLYQILS